MRKLRPFLAHTAPDAGRLPPADILPVSGSTIDDHASSRFNCSSTCGIASTVGPATPYDPGTQAHAASRVCCKSSVARSTAIHSLNRSSANSIATCTSCSLHKRPVASLARHSNRVTSTRNSATASSSDNMFWIRLQLLKHLQDRQHSRTIRPYPVHCTSAPSTSRPVACSVTAEAPVHDRLSSSDVWSLVSRKCP